jgi:hypothetical protein
LFLIPLRLHSTEDQGKQETQAQIHSLPERIAALLERPARKTFPVLRMVR